MIQESKNVGLNEILVEIHSELRSWFLVLTVLFMALFAITIYTDINVYLNHFYKDINNIEQFDTTSLIQSEKTTKTEAQKIERFRTSPLTSNTDVFFGSFNHKTYTPEVSAILIFSIIFLFVSMTFINGKKRVNQKDENSQMKWFMILSTILLCIYVYMTGGFLDSPFSSAISIYLSGFLLIQDRDDSKISNIIIIALAIFFVILPYLVYGYINVDDEIYFFNYSTKDNNVYFRLVITLGLVIYSLYSGQKISNKINKLYGIK
jgi:hypothetical protein